MEPFIANTDKRWFDYLARNSTDGRIDEVNFWSPMTVDPMKTMTPGEPVFLRLKSPFRAIAGYGFFAHHAPHDLFTAWRLFGWKNGVSYSAEFLATIAAPISSKLFPMSVVSVSALARLA